MFYQLIAGATISLSAMTVIIQLIFFPIFIIQNDSSRQNIQKRVENFKVCEILCKNLLLLKCSIRLAPLFRLIYTVKNFH